VTPGAGLLGGPDRGAALEEGGYALGHVAAGPDGGGVVGGGLPAGLILSL
jgi:hypothetical protein